MFAGKPTDTKRNAGHTSPYANVLRSFSEQSEAERPFVPMVGGSRMFMLLLYASVLVAASIEFFASQRIWYGSWWIYNAYVLVVTSVFVFLGMVMLITSMPRPRRLQPARPEAPARNTRVRPTLAKWAGSGLLEQFPRRVGDSTQRDAPVRVPYDGARIGEGQPARRA